MAVPPKSYWLDVAVLCSVRLWESDSLLQSRVQQTPEKVLSLNNEQLPRLKYAAQPWHLGRQVETLGV